MMDFKSICPFQSDCKSDRTGQKRLSGIHGLVNEKSEELFEVEGYTISVYEMKGSLDDEATIRLIERTYQQDHILMRYTDSTLTTKNKIIEAFVNTADFKLQISQQCMLLQRGIDNITVLYLETAVKRDFVIEEEIRNACLNGELSKYVSTDKTAYYMTLAGKKIYLSSDAEWIAPHRVIGENSQISWSEFSSLSRANQYLSNQVTIDKAENLEYLKEKEIEVVFDGKLVTARRVVFRDQQSETMADYMIVYYLVCELRGRHIACILSHYGYDKDDLYLPDLLQSVMTVPVETTDPSDTFSDKEYLYEGLYHNLFLFELQVSSWMPIGKLRNVYKVAPTIGAYLGVPIKKRMGIDLGIQMGIPIDGSFDYYMGNLVYETEATYFLGLNLRWRYHKILTPKVSYFTYLGIGYNWLSTDIESEYNEETDVSEYYKVGSLDVFGGVNVRYRRIGGFIEYHLTPYGNSSSVSYNMGHSSINCGVSFLF